MKSTLRRPLLVWATLAALPALHGCATTRHGGQTARNKAFVVQAFEQLFVENRVDEADRYLARGFIEHDPASRDGRAAFKAWFRQYLARYPHATNRIVRVVAEGNLVVIEGHFVTDSTHPDDRGMVTVDIFRVAGGKIAEHWDIIEPVPPRTSNPHTMW